MIINTTMPLQENLITHLTTALFVTTVATFDDSLKIPFISEINIEI